MSFVVSVISLILSLFQIFRFFKNISVKSSGLFLLWVATYARVFPVLCFFSFRCSFLGTFSANSNPLFISVVGYPLWCRVVFSYLK